MYIYFLEMKLMFQLFLPVCFAVVVLVCLELSSLAAPPGCSHGHTAGCRMHSLAELFDRVIQQSSRIHGVSSDLHSEFVSFFLSAFPSSSLSKTTWLSYWSKTPNKQACFCYLALPAGAILLPQQDPHREAKVPHIQHTNAWWQGPRTKARGKWSWVQTHGVGPSTGFTDALL